MSGDKILNREFHQSWVKEDVFYFGKLFHEWKVLYIKLFLSWLYYNYLSIRESLFDILDKRWIALNHYWPHFCVVFHVLHCSIFRRGYADGEIEAMFAKYDVDGDRVLDEEEQKRMQADLADQSVWSFFSLYFFSSKEIFQILSISIYV